MSDLTAFATADEFADLLGLVLADDEKTRASKLLARASDRIRRTVKQQISLVEDDDLTLPGTTEQRIMLPERPVVSVTSVTLDGSPLSDWYVAGNEIVRRGLTYADRILDSLSYGAGFGCEQQELTIVYTHGYAANAIPELCGEIAMEMVKRAWVNPGSVIQTTRGNVETTYAPYAAPPRGLALTDSERRELIRFFGSSAGSVWTGSGT